MRLRSWVGVLAWVVTAAAGGGGAFAQPKRPGDAIWAMPEGVIAYAAFDPSALGGEASRERALVAAGLRGLIANALVIEGGSAVARELLREDVLRENPYRVCLLDLQGEHAGKGSLKPNKFAAVIEIRATVHDRFRGAIDSALMSDAVGGGPRTRKEVALAGGLRGEVSTTGEAWREIGWVSRPESFVVAFGDGTLDRWVGAPAARSGGSWALRAAAVKKRGRGPLVLEVYANLDALRNSVPDEFDGRGLGELVHAWKIANARSFLVQGAMVPLDAKSEERGTPGPGVLAVTAAWSSRAQPPESVEAIALSESTWPDGAGERPTQWALVMRTSVPTWIDFGVDTYAALGAEAGFENKRRQWARRVKPMLERIVPRIGEWAVVRPGLELTVQLKKADGPDRLPSDLRALFSTLAPTVAAVQKNWELVVGETEKALLQGLMIKLEADKIATGWKAK